MSDERDIGSRVCLGRLRPLGVLLALSIVSCRTDPDLATAVSAAGMRQVSSARVPEPHAWTDLTTIAPVNSLKRPFSVAICGERLFVLDSSDPTSIKIFSESGHPLIGVANDKPKRFVRPAFVRCEYGGSNVVVGDADDGVVALLSPSGSLIREVGRLAMPHGFPFLGEVGLSSTGDWFESWLGVGIYGPVLNERDWAEASLVRQHRGFLVSDVGRPRRYASSLNRRGLNRTYLAGSADTVWVLTQGDATIHGFDPGGQAIAPIMLPVHHVGRNPITRMDPVLDSSTGLQGSKFLFQPNVAGLGVIQDSLFATIRYDDWRLTFLGGFPGGSLEFRARSSLDIVTRRGEVVRSLAVPGYAIELATDGQNAVAILVEGAGRVRRILFSRL